MVAARPFIEKNFHPTIIVGAYYKVIFINIKIGFRRCSRYIK